MANTSLYYQYTVYGGNFMANVSTKTKVIVAVVAVVLAVLVALTVLLVWYFNPTTDYDFDSFIKRHKIEIPEGFTRESAEEFYLWVVEHLQENPHMEFAFGWSGYELFARRIQVAYLEDNHMSVTEHMREMLDMFEEIHQK